MPTESRKSGTILIFTVMLWHAVHGEGSQSRSQRTLRRLGNFGPSRGSGTTLGIKLERH